MTAALTPIWPQWEGTLRNEVDSLKYINPTNSQTSDDYFLRDYKAEQWRNDHHHAAWQEELMWPAGKETHYQTVTELTVFLLFVDMI